MLFCKPEYLQNVMYVSLSEYFQIPYFKSFIKLPYIFRALTRNQHLCFAKSIKQRVKSYHKLLDASCLIWFTFHAEPNHISQGM